MYRFHTLEVVVVGLIEEMIQQDWEKLKPPKL